MSNDKSIRVNNGAADIVAQLASEEGITKVQAATRLVEEGMKAIKAQPGASAGEVLDGLLTCQYTDKNGNQYSVSDYAKQHTLTLSDAAARLIRIGLGREGALSRDRAKHPPARPKTPTPATPKSSRPPPPNPWLLPEVPESMGEGS